MKPEDPWERSDDEKERRANEIKTRFAHYSTGTKAPPDRIGRWKQIAWFVLALFIVAYLLKKSGYVALLFGLG